MQDANLRRGVNLQAADVAITLGDLQRLAKPCEAKCNTHQGERPAGGKQHISDELSDGSYLKESELHD